MVRKVLDCSMAHLRPATRDALDEHDLAATMHGAYGCLVHVPDPDEIGDFDPPLPDDLLDVFNVARSKECEFVLFDIDGSMLAELPTYED
jgi:hypothetical protein